MLNNICSDNEELHPLVSIIMPSYNSEKFILKAIASVTSQSYSKWELFVVDGGSNDSTFRLVKNITRFETRITIVDNKDDCGPAHARSVGVKLSRGCFIAFLDADDLWLPDKLSQQVSFMLKNNYSFSYTGYRRLSKFGKLGCLVPMADSYSYSRYLARRGIGCLTTMIKRSLLTDDVIGVWRRSGGEETLWWLLILKKGVVAHLLNIDLARYRDTAGSLSQNQIHTVKTVWSYYRNELNISSLQLIWVFPQYLVDAAVRKIRLIVCLRFQSIKAA